MNTATLNGKPQKVFINGETIKYLKYYEQTKTLEVCFESDSMYQYYGVDKALYQKFLESGNKREFFEGELFDKYEFRKFR